MGRLKRVQAPLEGGPRKEKKSTMAVDSDVAELIRRVAARDGLQLSDFLDRALQSYIRLNHPDWELEFDEDEDAGPFDDLAGEKVGTSVFGGDVTMPDRRDSDRRRKSGLGHAPNQRKGSDRRKAKKR